MTFSVEDTKAIYEGRFQWIDVPFPVDPKWSETPDLVSYLNQYHSTYKDSMPKVPKMFTYCDAARESDSAGIYCARVSYNTMVLKPKKWIIVTDTTDLPIVDSEHLKAPIDPVETIKFNTSVEFSSPVHEKGSTEPVHCDPKLRESDGDIWEKSVVTVVKQVQQVEPGCRYQPTRIYAKLLCDVVHAKEGEFLINAMDPNEIITTNPRGVPVEEKDKVSLTPHVKRIDEISGLYDACGKFVTVGACERDSEQMTSLAKAALAKIKLVVDPSDARLLVTGEAMVLNKDGLLLSNEDQHLLGALQPNSNVDFRTSTQNVALLFSSKMNTSPTVKLGGYHALDVSDILFTEHEVSYSPGSMVQVWKVLVRLPKN
ncbi:hypothetical protein BGZ80_000180 [Entomortierella chlamydospora]|uniref:Uncharacterized protein n=1 Tax=Entomortierella chlamydospora TaxID=101097 RepID=A0A9P6MT81_9FUNG|nr:hypothetical protein BGZ79_006731 [Entomortierella chlamydospora]KAG0012143.1 hypothetical protein BGZ80_000180 [Entomortierella chlamydospora]